MLKKKKKKSGQRPSLLSLQFSMCLRGIKQCSKKLEGAFLVAQWLRIHLPMQGTRVQALVQEDLTDRGATKPMRHNY